MVMVFASEKARKYLLKWGLVYTFRKTKRKKTGRDWITDKRGGSKMGDVFIQLIAGPHPPEYLRDKKEWISQSGFKTYQEWANEIKKLNKDKLPKEGYIYRVWTRLL